MCDLGFFEDYLVRSHKAGNTVSSYLRDVRRFLLAMEARGLKPEDIETADVQDFVDGMSRSGRSPATITRCLASIRSFFHCRMERGESDRNPALGVETDRVCRKPPSLLTEQEIALFLSQPDLSDAKGVRDRAMLETLYSTGLRASELISLNVEGVDLQNRVVHCLRNGRDTQLPLYPAAAEALGAYLGGARDTLVHSSGQRALFVNLSGERMSRQGFWKLIKYYQDKAHLQHTVNPHVLRHTFAAHLLTSGVDTLSLQNLIGHADYSSTQAYVRLLEDSMQRREAR